jgi:hypothetical protein
VTPTMFLRIGSVVALVQFAAHTLLFVSSAPKHGPEETAVVEAMKAHRFDFMGSMRSYWDFYFGYGLEAAFVCLIEAVLLSWCDPSSRSSSLPTSDTQSWPGSTSSSRPSFQMS